MSIDFWNLRYSENGFAYGMEPNDFLKEQEFKAKSSILCLAEGEGRNAVYLAGQGHDVTAIDIAYEGLAKTKDLAVIKNVQVKTICADLAEYSFEPERWDAVVIIFGHFPPEIRQKIHREIYKTLKHGGKLIIEAYSKEQLHFKTGGPMDEKMLYSIDELKEDFSDFEDIIINQAQREIHEGKFHNGQSSVIQLIAIKK